MVPMPLSRGFVLVYRWRALLIPGRDDTLAFFLDEMKSERQE